MNKKWGELKLLYEFRIKLFFAPFLRLFAVLEEYYRLLPPPGFIPWVWVWVFQFLLVWIGLPFLSPSIIPVIPSLPIFWILPENLSVNVLIIIDENISYFLEYQLKYIEI